MGYKLIISERAGQHIDKIVDYVVNDLYNPGAAKAILTDIEEAYSKLEYMADALSYCMDPYLAEKGYRKIILSKHDYVILYRIEGNEVRISGVFHMREDYASKL